MSDQIADFQYLWGDILSMWTHTYPYKHLRMVKVAIYNHQVDGAFSLGPDISYGDLCFYKQKKKKKERKKGVWPWVTLVILTKTRCY